MIKNIYVSIAIISLAACSSGKNLSSTDSAVTEVAETPTEYESPTEYVETVVEEEYILPESYQYYMNNPVDVDPNFVDSRKIKHLYSDDSGFVVFFDNGKAIRCINCEFCEESLTMIRHYPTPMIFSEYLGYVTFSRPEEKYDTGLKLASDKWVFKNFEQLKEINKCN